MLLIYFLFNDINIESFCPFGSKNRKTARNNQAKYVYKLVNFVFQQKKIKIKIDQICIKAKKFSIF